ncbi:MAG TPA: hypothetical protein VK550_02875 [Polyangiaceae bacterium]|nr:hypothetical protein [Polyangiaceae bacterium]
MAPRFWAMALGLGTLASVLGTGACGTDASGVDACRKIEQARCRKAASCPDLGLRGSVGIEECVQYARDRCFHGLAVADPGTPAIQACVNAIDQATSCEIVATPEMTPACEFLRPPTGPVDAGAEASSDDVAALDVPGTTDGG